MASYRKRVRKRLARLVRSTPPTTIDYWRSRAGEHGRRAVLDLRHDTSEYESVTARQQHDLLPVLNDRLTGNEAILLDLGCGPGRFTAALAETTGGFAIGVDPIGEFLRLAEPHQAVRYAQASADRLPFRDATFDVVWCCLVLGALNDRDLQAAVTEVSRVMRPDGLLAIVDNTTPGTGGPNYHFRSIDCYVDLFSPVALRRDFEYVDMDETISFLIGRSEP